MADNVLVTGASGYLGLTLVRELVRHGGRVTVLRHPRDRAPLPTGVAGHVETRVADLADATGADEAVRGAALVYHLAGATSPSSRFADATWRTNVLGTYHVARSCMRHGTRRMVHVSSTAAVGYPPDGVIADEDFAQSDSVLDNAYAASKRAGEHLVLDLAAQGLDAVVVNPAAVFAPSVDQKRSWGALAHAAARGLLRAVPKGGTAVCSARDFVAGTIAAASKGESGRRYILATANLSYRRIAELLVAATGRSHPVRELPAGVFRALGKANQALRGLVGSSDPADPLVPENVELMVRELYYDPSRAARELGVGRSSVEALISEFVR